MVLTESNDVRRYSMNLLQQVSDRVKSETYLTPDEQTEVLARFASSLKARLMQQVIDRLHVLTETTDNATQWQMANLILDRHQQLRAARAAAHQAKAAAGGT